MQGVVARWLRPQLHIEKPGIFLRGSVASMWRRVPEHCIDHGVDGHLVGQ